MASGQWHDRELVVKDVVTGHPARVTFQDSHLGRLRRHVGHDLLVSPGAQVLVLDERDRALLLRCSDTGEWALPAGAWEPGDSFRITATRELLEETGLLLDPDDLVPFASISTAEVHTIRCPNGDLVHAFALCFWARASSHTRLGGDGEGTDFQWCPLNVLATPTFAVTAEAVRVYLRYQDTGLFQAD